MLIHKIVISWIVILDVIKVFTNIINLVIKDI